MRSRPEERFAVDFPLFLSWQRKDGAVLRLPANCVDLSASGAKVTTRERMEPHSTVVVQSSQFGRMGTATIRYCVRSGMRYNVGVHFGSALNLSDPVRRKILESVLRPQAEQPALPVSA